MTSCTIPCKIFERVMYSSIYEHLEANFILCASQNGFKNCSCETQFVTTIHDIATYYNSGKQVDVLFLDFSKALNKVRTS